jgi:isocitrate dehydrogenase
MVFIPMIFLKKGLSKEKVGTKEFAEAVIANLGAKPSFFKEVIYANNSSLNLPKYQRKASKNKELIGVDLFVHWNGENVNDLAEKVQKLTPNSASLSMITNRGIKVWPDGFKETFCTDHWRCRIKASSNNFSNADIISLLQNVHQDGVDFIKTENLYKFDGVEAFSAAQGQ